MMEVSVSIDISVLGFYGYIGYIEDISWIFLHEYQYIIN